MNKKLSALAITLATITLLGAGCGKNFLPGSRDNKPAEPAISVDNQSLPENNQVVIKQASINEDGWVVIHAKENGQLGDAIGYTFLAAGTDSKIKITVDRNKVTPSLVAELHYDRDVKGTFDFPKGDGPVIRDTQVIMQEFTVLNQSDIKKDTSASVRKEFVISAKQWSFTPSSITVKKGETVVLKLKSTDVTHGFSIPDFNINETMEPEVTKTIEFVADKVGTFTFSCNIPCGAGHKAMTGTITVE